MREWKCPRLDMAAVWSKMEILYMVIETRVIHPVVTVQKTVSEVCES